MKKLLIAFTVSLWAVGQAYAGSTTVPITAGTGTNVAVTTDGSSNVYWRNTLWDYAAGANGAGVDTSHGLLVDPASAAAWGVGATGSTVPANANYMGIISGGNLVGWTGAVTQGTAANLNMTEANSANILSAVQGSIPAGSNLIGSIQQYIGSGVVSTTNGGYNNLLQGNAVISATNGLYTNLLVGNAAVATGTGAQGSTTPRVTVATDSATVAGSANNDACMFGAKTNLAISYQSTSITQLIALSGSTKIYVCSLSLIASVATTFSITGGTGTNCGTPAALIGTTSASNGLSLAANGGLTYGNGGGTVAVTGAGSELCIVQSGGGNLVGNLTYVQQ